MYDEVMLAIATAVAGKTVEGAIAGGRKAYESIAAMIKRRFEGDSSVETALADAERDPEQHTERLAMALSVVAGGDPEFDRKLRQEWERLHPTINASENATVNSVSGTVSGSVIQVGRVNTSELVLQSEVSQQ